MNRKPILNNCIMLALTLLLFSCAQNQASEEGISQWDFDHNVQFSQTQNSENFYYIEIMPNDKTPFPKLSAFLMRRALLLCKTYGFKIEVLQGVASYD